MKTDHISNEDYNTILKQHLESLKRIRDAATGLAKGMIGSTLYKEDLFFASVLNRSLSLLDGFSVMLTSRNLACAGIILRAQLDNCMRLYASFIADNKSEFIDRFMEGRRIDKLKDDQGNKMSDYLLRTRLEEYDSRINEVYEKASGYVHLSNIAFKLSLHEINADSFEFAIGLPLKEDANEYLIEAAEAFLHYMKLLYFMLNSVVESKERAEKVVKR